MLIQTNYSKKRRGDNHMLTSQERKWISKNVPNGKEIVGYSNPNAIIDALSDYSVDQMVGDDYEPTEKCIIAERIIDRIALYDDDWPEWDGS